MKNSSGKLCLYCGKPASQGVSLIIKRAPGRVGALARFERAGGIVWVCADHLDQLAVFVWADRRPGHQPEAISQAD